MKHMHTTTTTLALLAACGLALSGCGESGSDDDHGHAEDTHTHADGSTHGEHADDETMDVDDHEHDEVALNPAIIGDMTVELAQNHGAIKGGQESHLVVKLPYNDNGSTVVRAWIGTDDRTLSYVGKGEYAASHDDYDIHTMAPDPLPENSMWWIEVEKPDGTKVIGSTEPIRE
jgi:ABC-type Zn2+ transport system substrate-binding protein/surface adhesin